MGSMAAWAFGNLPISFRDQRRLKSNFNVWDENTLREDITSQELVLAQMGAERPAPVSKLPLNDAGKTRTESMARTSRYRRPKTI